MSWLYAVQLAVPLILIGWLVKMPARSRLGFVVPVFGGFAALAVMGLQAIWLLPPWWAPLVFAAVLGVATWLEWRRIRPSPSALPDGGGAWIVLALFVVLGTMSTYGTVSALQSRTPPVDGVVNQAFPLQPGRYPVVNGGSFFSTNLHLETLNADVPRYRAWRGQSCGVDLVALDGFGLRARGAQPADPHAYFLFGARVLAPCAGQVVIVVDGLPDLRVPEVDRDHMAGNHVVLRCAQADVTLGQLQPGSVRVQARANVAVGDWLASVGNSGNTGEPHLHIHAQGRGPPGAPWGGDPRPIEFNGRFPVRGDRIEAPWA